MNRLNQSLLVVACVFLLAGCGHHHAIGQAINHKAQVRKLSDGGYKVKLSYSVTYRQPMFKQPLLVRIPFLYYTAASFDYTNWLYLPRTNGAVDASNVVLMTEEGGKGDTVQGMTGMICFSNGMMTVNMNLPLHPIRPIGPNTVYVPYFLNSTYQLE